MEIIRVSSKGQVVIPDNIRKRLKIKAGSNLVLLEKEGSLIIKKEEDFARYFEQEESREIIGWMALAEKSLNEVWNNPKDERVWKRYL